MEAKTNELVISINHNIFLWWYWWSETYDNFTKNTPIFEFMFLFTSTDNTIINANRIYIYICRNHDNNKRNLSQIRYCINPIYQIALEWENLCVYSPTKTLYGASRGELKRALCLGFQAHRVDVFSVLSYNMYRLHGKMYNFNDENSCTIFYKNYIKIVWSKLCCYLFANVDVSRREQSWIFGSRLLWGYTARP